MSQNTYHQHRASVQLCRRHRTSTLDTQPGFLPVAKPRAHQSSGVRDTAHIHPMSVRLLLSGCISCSVFPRSHMVWRKVPTNICNESHMLLSVSARCARTCVGGVGLCMCVFPSCNSGMASREERSVMRLDLLPKSLFFSVASHSEIWRRACRQKRCGVSLQ